MSGGRKFRFEILNLPNEAKSNDLPSVLHKPKGKYPRVL